MRPQAAHERGPRRRRGAPHRRAAGGARQRPQAAVGCVGWAAANWLLDAPRCGCSCAPSAAPDFDALIVAFGLVNVLAVIPILPGGLGIDRHGLPLALVGFGVSRATAVLGVGTYRLAQFFFPIVLGGLMYTSLRVGPWSIERRDRLRRLRDLADEPTTTSESALDFAVALPARRRRARRCPATGRRRVRRRSRRASDVDVSHDDPTTPTSCRRRSTTRPTSTGLHGDVRR